MRKTATRPKATISPVVTVAASVAGPSSNVPV